MAQNWDYWLADLKEPQGRDVTDPGQGFWRHKAAKTKTDWPIAIWFEGEEPQIKVGNSLKSGTDELLEFLSGATWLNAVAVSHADYKAAMSDGFWPGDGKPARKMDDAERMGIDTAAGENNAPIEETLADQIAAAVAKANAMPEPKTQAEADAATGLVDKLRKLWKLADNQRVEEKRPYDEAAQAVQDKWLPIMTPAKDAGAGLDTRRKAFLKKEQARLDAIAAEERRKQQAIVDAENERIRKENAERAAEAAKDGNPLGVGVPLEPEIAAPVVETQRATASSTFGRASGLKEITVLDTLDVGVLAKHFIDTNDDDFREYLEKRAKAAIRAKVSLPGVTTKKELQ